MVRTIRVLFRGGGNIDLKLITCEDNIVNPSKLQSCVLNWYHAYIIHPVMDITEAMIFQHLYFSDIIDVFQKEVNKCDTCQHTKKSNKNDDKLPTKLAGKIL